MVIYTQSLYYLFDIAMHLSSVPFKTTLCQMFGLIGLVAFAINLRSLFHRSSTLTSRSSTVCTLVFPRKKNKPQPHTIINIYKKEGEGANNQLN